MADPRAAAVQFPQAQNPPAPAQVQQTRTQHKFNKHRIRQRQYKFNKRRIHQRLFRFNKGKTRLLKRKVKRREIWPENLK